MTPSLGAPWPSLRSMVDSRDETYNFRLLHIVRRRPTLSLLRSALSNFAISCLAGSVVV